MQPRMTLGTLRATIMVIFAVVVALVVPHQANAWELSKSTNGVVIQRTGDAAGAAANVRIYYGYKGDADIWPPPLSLSSVASYDHVSTAFTIFDSASTVQAVELPLIADGGVWQLVRVQASGFPDAWFIARSEPLNVSVRNSPAVKLSQPATVTVANALTIESAPPVSLDSSVSIDGTLPVSVDSIGPLNAQGIAAGFGVLFVLAGIVSFRYFA